MSENDDLITTLESNRHGPYGDLRKQAAEALRSDQQEIERLQDAVDGCVKKMGAMIDNKRALCRSIGALQAANKRLRDVVDAAKVLVESGAWPSESLDDLIEALALLENGDDS